MPKPPPSRIVTNVSPRTKNIAAGRGNKKSKSAATAETMRDVLEDYEAYSVGVVLACDKYPNAKTGENTLPDLECAVADGRLLCRMLCGLEPTPKPDGTWESPDDGSCGPVGGMSQGFRCWDGRLNLNLSSHITVATV